MLNHAVSFLYETRTPGTLLTKETQLPPNIALPGDKHSLSTTERKTEIRPVSDRSFRLTMLAFTCGFVVPPLFNTSITYNQIRLQFILIIINYILNSEIIRFILTII